MSFSLATTRHAAPASAARLGSVAWSAVTTSSSGAGGLLASGCAASVAMLAAPRRLPFAVRQIRGKNCGIKIHQGVVVQLIEDVPTFGPKDTLLRIDRGRMRNDWYPRRRAVYMPTARRVALGLDDRAIRPRDTRFQAVAASASSAHDSANAGTAPDPVSLPPPMDPQRAAALLTAKLPSALVFRRRAIGAPSAAIFGSVSADDVAAAVREALRASGDATAAQAVRLEGRDVRFVDGGAQAQDDHDNGDHVTADRVKALGRWEVELTVRGGPPVYKIVEVVAEE